MSTLLDAFLRLAGAIVLETVALMLWNVGTRSPLTVLAAIVRAGRRPRTLLAGLATFVIGLIFVAAAVVLLLPAIPSPADDFVAVEIFTFLVALTLEYLIGNDVRSLGGGTSR